MTQGIFCDNWLGTARQHNTIQYNTGQTGFLAGQQATGFIREGIGQQKFEFLIGQVQVVPPRFRLFSSIWCQMNMTLLVLLTYETGWAVGTLHTL